jgi:hypothetical protein
MMREKDLRIIERFSDRVRGGTPRGVRVTLRIAGGLPSERLHYRFILDGNGEASIDVSDARDPTACWAREEKLDVDATEPLLTEIERRLERFASRGQAAFVPDSPIGYATIEVNGDLAELLFAPDESLLPSARETEFTPLKDLARRTILAAQRAPVDEDD